MFYQIVINFVIFVHFCGQNLFQANNKQHPLRSWREEAETTNYTP